MVKGLASALAAALVAAAASVLAAGAAVLARARLAATRRRNACGWGSARGERGDGDEARSNGEHDGLDHSCFLVVSLPACGRRSFRRIRLSSATRRCAGRSRIRCRFRRCAGRPVPDNRKSYWLRLTLECPRGVRKGGGNEGQPLARMEAREDCFLLGNAVARVEGTSATVRLGRTWAATAARFRLAAILRSQEPLGQRRHGKHGRCNGQHKTGAGENLQLPTSRLTLLGGE